MEKGTQVRLKTRRDGRYKNTAVKLWVFQGSGEWGPTHPVCPMKDTPVGGFNELPTSRSGAGRCRSSWFFFSKESTGEFFIVRAWFSCRVVCYLSSIYHWGKVIRQWCAAGGMTMLGVGFLSTVGCGKNFTVETPPTPATAALTKAEVKGFLHKSSRFRDEYEYGRMSIVALLSGNSVLNRAMVDVEGVFFINTKPQCFLYLDQESVKERRYFNGVFLTFDSEQDEKAVLAQAKSGSSCRIFGKFLTKSEVDYGWSSGTLQVNKIEVFPRAF